MTMPSKLTSSQSAHTSTLSACGVHTSGNQTSGLVVPQTGEHTVCTESASFFSVLQHASVCAILILMRACAHRFWRLGFGFRFAQIVMELCEGGALDDALMGTPRQCCGACKDTDRCRGRGQDVCEGEYVCVCEMGREHRHTTHTQHTHMHRTAVQSLSAGWRRHRSVRLRGSCCSPLCTSTTAP